MSDTRFCSNWECATRTSAIAGFAKRAGFDLVGEFHDAAVISGKGPIEARARLQKHSSRKAPAGFWRALTAASAPAGSRATSKGLSTIGTE
jgi:hypothetical protein